MPYCFKILIRKLKCSQKIFSIADLLLGSNYGQLIRDAASDMPFDPVDLLFVLGQNSFDSQQLVTCQSAILLLLYMSSLYDDRLADVKLMFASLEQYILLNFSESFVEANSPVRLEWLVSLYGLCRSLAKVGYQIPYSPEAEKIIFQLIDERGCDLLDSGMHISSLKWLFQQGKICKSLTDQLLKFCRCNSSNSNFIVDQRKDDHLLELDVVAELIASGDNYAPLLLVWLLRDVIQNDQENDYLSVVSILTRMIEILPTASNQLSANGIGEAIQKIYHHPMYSSSLEIRMVSSKLVFTLLHSVSSNSISDGDAWGSMVVKLVDSLVHTIASEGWIRETLIILGILSLVLHHSTNNALIEASKTVLLNTPLILTINSAIFDACSKGPALTDLDEETSNGEILISLLLLLFYSIRSVDAILPGILDWQNLFDMQDKMQHLSYISIRCHDLCKLIHYGSPVIKLIASQCLLDIFSKISVHKIKKQVELEIRTGYLLSVVAILEGLVFYEDVRVSTNCALCLAIIMSWEELNIELLVSERSQWCRLVIEELVMSFAAPCLASKSFVVHHKPAVHIVVALLKMRNLLKWLSSVLDSSCISGIIEKLSPNQVTAELVVFFRELLLAGYLKPDQIAIFGRMLQACRKHISTGEIRDLREEHTEKIIDVGSDDLQRVSGVLMHNMIHLSSFNTNSKGLLEEIELFSKCLMEED
ncbi:hypothetical protein Leryth_007919 [Lithospermum erythrorhizon]|nr:hypothetical protein Leryth_007919 [Lithospermum erythrorhizon]